MSSTKKWLLLALTIFLVCVVAFIGLLTAGYLYYKRTRPPSPDLQTITSAPTGPVLLRDGGKEFRAGTLVRVSSWAGKYDSTVTGLTSGLSIDAGRVGHVTGVTNRSSEYIIPDQVLMVRWVEQEWSCFPRFWQMRKVDSFTATINADWVEPLK